LPYGKTPRTRVGAESANQADALRRTGVLAQRPDAERVAGFRKWQPLGRQVRKGEKPLRIFGYSIKKVTEQDETSETQGLQIYVLLFRRWLLRAKGAIEEQKPDRDEDREHRGEHGQQTAEPGDLSGRTVRTDLLLALSKQCVHVSWFFGRSHP
jgi:hypothetical protein